ncbi:MAG: phosphodiesterase [Homoserinimonas sp.]|jgi:Icc protein|nr:phosphodiesterase [Homoserinimonas sp.]
MTQLGQHPAPVHTLAHISDTHFLAGGERLFSSVEAENNLKQALHQLERSGIAPEALIFTGDLADHGLPDAYQRLRGIVEPVAQRIGAQVIWVMGNHDERLQYSAALFDEAGSSLPQDRVYNIKGLRVICLDTTVPGYHHGELEETQLEWLREELAIPAPHGTLIALHHPPIPTPLLWAMQMLELRDQDRLAAVIKATDVRGILAGHLHYSTHSMFAGIPVSVVSATCYSLDLTAQDRLLSGVNSGQAISIVHVYEDRVVHSLIPLGETVEITGFSAHYRSQIEAMTPEQRVEAFSNKRSTFNLRDERPTETTAG